MWGELLMTSESWKSSVRNMSYTTRSSFLERVKLGDEKAWFEFYKKYVGMIRYVGAVRGLSPSECDDLMQALREEERGRYNAVLQEFRSVP